MTKTRRRGFFHAAMDALIEARTRQAQRHVNQTLRMLDDKTLMAAGYKRKEL